MVNSNQPRAEENIDEVEIVRGNPTANFTANNPYEMVSDEIMSSQAKEASKQIELACSYLLQALAKCSARLDKDGNENQNLSNEYTDRLGNLQKGDNSIKAIKKAVSQAQFRMLSVSPNSRKVHKALSRENMARGTKEYNVAFNATVKKLREDEAKKND